MKRKPNRAELTLAFGRTASVHARVTISNGGLVAVGALVSAILLSAAALVHAAGSTRNG